MFQWKPEGALLQEEKSYVFRFLDRGMNIENSYHPNKLADFKMVLKTDAAAWADALDLALAELQAGTLEFTFQKGPRILGEYITPQEYANTNNPTSLGKMSEFIAFLRKGPFQFYYDD